MKSTKIYCDSTDKTCRANKQFGVTKDTNIKNNLKKKIQSFFEDLNKDLKSKHDNCFIAGTYIFEGDEVFNLCCPCAVQRGTIDNKFVSHEFFMYNDKFQRQKLTLNNSSIVEPDEDNFNKQYEIDLPEGIKYPCDSECINNTTTHCKKNLEHKKSILFYKFRVKYSTEEEPKTYTFVKLERYITYKLNKKAAIHGLVMILHYFTNHIKNNSYPHRREDMIYHIIENKEQIKLQPKHVVSCNTRAEDTQKVLNHTDDIVTFDIDIKTLEDLQKDTTIDIEYLNFFNEMRSFYNNPDNINTIEVNNSVKQTIPSPYSFPKDYKYTHKCFINNKSAKITVDPTSIYTEYGKDFAMCQKENVLDALHHYNKYVRIRNELFVPSIYYKQFLPTFPQSGGKSNVSYKKYGKYTVLLNGKQRDRIVWIYNRQFFIKRRDGSYEKIKKKNII